jgi:hypothetical protein
MAALLAVEHGRHPTTQRRQKSISRREIADIALTDGKSARSRMPPVEKIRFLVAKSLTARRCFE